MHAADIAIGASRWGVLPIALVLAASVVVNAARLAHGRIAERLLTGATLTLGAFVIGVRVLGAIGLCTPTVSFVLLIALAAGMQVAARPRALGLQWSPLATKASAPLLVVTGLGLLYIMVAAYLLPVWQWDALGYHLPFVDFVLQDGTFSAVPDDVPYLTTYPHAVELLFAAWRMMIPDDRLVDAAHIPLGLFGALAIATLAKELGARTEDSVLAGAAWLVVPAVWLQLPTNYVDAASAAFLVAGAVFVLAPPSAQRMLGAGVALGLLLGSKPNAPIATSLLFALLFVRTWRTPFRRHLLLVAGCTLLLGAESFVVNIARHHNPIWPVHMKLGPITLPGTLPMSTLLESGANAPRLHGFVVFRVLRSWATLDAPPVFDMRFGGMGPLFLLALPAAVWVAWKRRSLAMAACFAAALASPDPAVPRYVLAVPALAFAFGAPLLADARERLRSALLVLGAVVAAIALWRASPGIIGEGPPLMTYFAMTEEERATAVGADGRPTKFFDARTRLGPGEKTLFDASFDLPYLAWPTDLSRRVGRISDSATEGEVALLLDDPSVRLLVVGDDLPAGTVARKRPDTFTPLFHCKSSSCTVYARY